MGEFDTHIDYNSKQTMHFRPKWQKPLKGSTEKDNNGGLIPKKWKEEAAIGMFYEFMGKHALISLLLIIIVAYGGALGLFVVGVYRAYEFLTKPLTAEKELKRYAKYVDLLLNDRNRAKAILEGLNRAAADHHFRYLKKTGEGTFRLDAHGNTSNRRAHINITMNKHFVAMDRVRVGFHYVSDTGTVDTEDREITTKQFILFLQDPSSLLQTTRPRYTG